MSYSSSLDALLPRYLDLWRRLDVHAGAAMPAGLELLERYGELNRAYHNLTHLADVLEKLDWARQNIEGLSARDFDRIELALFYHDAIYDAKAHDNEAQSRDLFVADATRFGLPPDDIEAVARLIDLTANHLRATSLDEQVMADCDLSILGAAPDIFAAYNKNIRREYSYIPAAIWDKRRQSFLNTMLEAPRLFKTEAFHDLYDTAARRNLRQAMTATSPVRRLLNIFKR